jgi:hypothetical protein
MRLGGTGQPETRNETVKVQTNRESPSKRIREKGETKGKKWPFDGTKGKSGMNQV